MSSLVANTLPAVDTSGTFSFPQEADEPAPEQPIYVIAAAPVILLGQSSSTAAGATLPANVVCPVPGKGGYLRAPSATVSVSYFYVTNTGG